MKNDKETANFCEESAKTALDVLTDNIKGRPISTVHNRGAWIKILSASYSVLFEEANRENAKLFAEIERLKNALHSIASLPSGSLGAYSKFAEAQIIARDAYNVPD